MNDLVSIIIPVYNMGNSLEGCVWSILEQDYENIEVILVDDGSKDNSYDVCKKIASKDSRVKCIHTENQGSGPARNTGIRESRGRYLYFPDADDFLEPNAVSVLVDAMSDGEYDLIVFGYRNLTHEGAVISERKYEEFKNTGDAVRADYSDYFGMNRKFSIQGAPWNKFFDGETVRKNNIEYPPLRRHQDEGFISRYVSYCKNIRFIPDVLYTYYQNTVSLEWKKYPVDYIDAVTGLDEVWKQTIIKWNPEDKNTHLLVEKEIFSRLITVLELSYSPKMNFNFWDRLKWIKKVLKKTKFNGYKMEIVGSTYQKAILLCAKLHLHFILSCALYAGIMKSAAKRGK